MGALPVALVLISGLLGSNESIGRPAPSGSRTQTGQRDMGSSDIAPVIYPRSGSLHSRIRRAATGIAIGAAVIVSLTACTPGESVAYHVVGTDVDLAFCDSFTASSAEFDFSKYPPPFMGPKYSIAIRELSGEPREFGSGVPISQSMFDWARSDVWDEVPANWERLDVRFLDSTGAWVGSALLFHREVVSDDWAWTSGLNIADPTCRLRLDPQ